jgi:7,8-dihydro-6-hydroxymethylpterin-pyrophosphokinase
VSPMALTIPISDARTRQFLMSMCAQAQSQWAAQRIQTNPLQALQVYAPLNRQAVLDMLQD